jgi:hypothetical protein
MLLHSYETRRLNHAEIRNQIYDIILANKPPSQTTTNVHYAPILDTVLASRYHNHQYVGFSHVNRNVRAEFGPMYNFVRSVPFSEMGYILHSHAHPNNALWEHHLMLIFSAFAIEITPDPCQKLYPSFPELFPATKEVELSEAPGVDISPLLCIDWTLNALCWTWQSNLGYNEHAYSSSLNAICRILSS